MVNAQFVIHLENRLEVLLSDFRTLCGSFHTFQPSKHIPAMSFLPFLHTCLFFLSICGSAIASPCQQKRDTSSLDLFSSGEKSLDDESLTLAFATSIDADFFSSDYADSNVSIFSSSTDESSPAAVDGADQKLDPISAVTGSASDGEARGTSESSFLRTDSEAFSGDGNLVADLPYFGGITDILFKDLENEKSCPADGAPTGQSGGREKIPDTRDETFENDKLTPEDKRRCPSSGGRQPIALCCISIFEENAQIQRQCYRSTSISSHSFYARLKSPLTNPSLWEYSHRPSVQRLFGLRFQLGAML